jgi:hypothetical protein
MNRPYAELVIEDLAFYDPELDPKLVRYIIEALVEMGHIYDAEVFDDDLTIEVIEEPEQLSFNFDVIGEPANDKSK